MEQGGVKRRTVGNHTDEQDEQLPEERRKPNSVSSIGIPFFSWEILQIVLIHCIAGAFFGYGIGFVGPYYTYVTISHNCSAITNEEVCTLSENRCTWNNNNNKCDFFQNPCTGLLQNKCEIQDDSIVSLKCYWNTKSNLCQPKIGYSVVQNGIFAGALVVGGCIGSFSAGSLLSFIGRKTTFLFSGILSCIAAMLTHTSTYTDQYAMVISGRILAGITAGILCVASPMYVEEVTPLQYRQIVGVFFQISCTFGIFLAAIMGLILNPIDFSIELHMQLRRQGLCVIPSLLSILLVFCGLFMRESPQWIEERLHIKSSTEECTSLNNLLNETPGNTNENYKNIHNNNNNNNNNENIKKSWKIMVKPLITSIILCIAQQMTGINAIMNYAPNIASVMGFKPLTGNFIVMFWNFISVLLSIPISSKFRPDYTYIVVLFPTSLCALMTGIIILPVIGVSSIIKRVISTLGIMLFILLFEVGLGSFFWTLTQGIFPPSFRPFGSSFTVLFQFLLNIAINVFFPIAVEEISGGPSGNQDKGMGIAFIFFGCMGLVAGIYLSKNLRLWEFR